MKKLLLIVLIFLIIGAVSAQDSLNNTTDNLLKDSEYTSYIDDDGEMLVVEENEYIPVEVNVDEPWSLNVYIDSHNSTINEELDNVDYNQIEIPTSVMMDDEVPLALGKHNIVYEFKFTNTTSIYKPDAYISDSGVYFDFNFIRNSKNPQNSIYRFNSQFNIIKPVEPISTTFNLDAIDITRTDSLSFNLKGISYSKVEIYLDDAFFDSFETDENPYEDEIDTTKLKIGSYNLVCILETDRVYGEYNINADTSDSMLNINFAKSKIVHTPNRHITIINTTLNVCDFPELNTIYINGPPIDITYTRSVPIRFEGEDAGDLEVFIDGTKVYNNSILLTWENNCYIPTKDSNGNYFAEGTHDISFEFVLTDKYARFKPKISWLDNVLTFNFLDSRDSGAFLNDKYIIKSKLNIINKNKQVVPIDSNDVVRIVHTNDIKVNVDGLAYPYNLTVFVDDVEIYDSSPNNDSVNIKTFLERTSIEETNERDVKTGTHSIRFEFVSLLKYDVDVSIKDGTLNFKFNLVDSNANPNGVYHQLNTSLIVSEKKKTVHILNVKNHTYFDDTEFVVKMDLYKPENDDDWEDDDVENPIGTQDVGIIVSDKNGVILIEDNLMNIYKSMQWNYEFENEKLPKAGIYTIKIINLADNTYDTASFEVKKANRMFKKKYSSDDFNVLFTLDFSSCKGDLNSPCHITLNKEEKVINVKKGAGKNKKEVLFKDIDPGTYTATFTLKGNDIYNDITLKSKVTVKKEAPTITYHKSGTNKIDLTIDISKSKTDGILTVSAGGEEKRFAIDKNTKHLTVEFNNLNSGHYNVKIEFKGNERYTTKTLTASLDIPHASNSPVTQSPEKTTPKGKGLGNNTGGTGTGSGDSNVAGSGNGTYNGKITFNGKGFDGDLGSQGSGHGDGAKSYEITKNIMKNENTVNALLIFLIIAIILFVLSFIYERRENNDEEEY